MLTVQSNQFLGISYFRDQESWNTPQSKYLIAQHLYVEYDPCEIHEKYIQGSGFEWK
jgi:hypothetical protein